MASWRARLTASHPPASDGLAVIGLTGTATLWAKAGASNVRKAIKDNWQVDLVPAPEESSLLCVTATVTTAVKGQGTYEDIPGALFSELALTLKKLEKHQPPQRYSKDFPLEQKVGNRRENGAKARIAVIELRLIIFMLFGGVSASPMGPADWPGNSKYFYAWREAVSKTRAGNNLYGTAGSKDVMTTPVSGLW